MRSNKKSIKFCLAAAIAFGLLISCGGGGGGTPPSNAKAITAFSFASPAVTGIINESAKTISVTVPNGTDVTALVAIFTTTGASVKVGSTVQTSGTTPNDFTNPVVYTVTAADNSIANYTVTVTIAEPPASAAINLPKTGQTICYDSSGAVISCAGTGQDGELQKGAAWPGPRFTNADGTTPVSDSVVVDQLTGLMWSRATGTGPAACAPYQALYWPNALSHIACLNTNNYLGYSDWRLPNSNELRSLVNREVLNSATWLNNQGFSIDSGDYWSSTTAAADPTTAWLVAMSDGIAHSFDKYSSRYVLPVRDAQAGAPFNIAQTGQTTCYDGLGTVISCTDAGQDGSYRKGVAWPNPRFTTNPDTSITDNLTGLIWAQDANVMLTRDPTWDSDLWNNNGGVYWQHALDYIAKLNSENYLGHNDWRLPNINELESLVPAGQANPGTWLESQGFSNAGAQYASYWSSTTSLYGDTWTPANSAAMALRSDTGLRFYHAKAGNESFVWPVRGGQ